MLLEIRASLLTWLSSCTPLQRSLISAFCGLMGYGAWAYLVNMGHGSGAAIKAACVQGSYSFILTLIMTLLIEALYKAGSALFEHELLIKSLTIVITCTILYSTSWLVNSMAGTPEIFSTVILGYVVGSLYTIVYVFGLSGQKIRKNA